MLVERLGNVYFDHAGLFASEVMSRKRTVQVISRAEVQPLVVASLCRS